MSVIPIVQIILRKREAIQIRLFLKKLIHLLNKLQDRWHCNSPYCPWVWPSGSVIPNRTILSLLLHWNLPDSWQTFILAAFQQGETLSIHSLPAQMPGQGNPAAFGRGKQEESIILAAHFGFDIWWLRPFLASHKAQMCQPQLWSQCCSQGLAELCTARVWAGGDVVPITLRNKTELQTQSLSSQPFPSPTRDGTKFQAEELITLFSSSI